MFSASGCASHGKQRSIFKGAVGRSGEERTARCAIRFLLSLTNKTPSASPHQTGLDVETNPRFESAEAAGWLAPPLAALMLPGMVIAAGLWLFPAPFIRAAATW